MATAVAVVGNRLCTIGEGRPERFRPDEGSLAKRSPVADRLVWRRADRCPRGFHRDERFGVSRPDDHQGRLAAGTTAAATTTVHLLTKCWYGPLFECRDLQAETDAAGQCSASVVVRNTGSLNGAGSVTLSMDGQPLPPQGVTLNRDMRNPRCIGRFPFPAESIPSTVDNLSATLEH